MIMMADSEVNWAAMPLSGVFETQNGALVLVGAFKANPLRDICTALDLDDLSLDARFATSHGTVQAQGRAARDLPRALRQQHPRALAGAARGAGPAVGAGARHARGAGRSADAAQRDDPGRRRRPTAGRCASSPARSAMSGAQAGLRRAPPQAGRAHRGSAGRSPRPRRASGADERRLRSGRPCRHGHDRPARGAERGRPARPRPNCSGSGASWKRDDDVRAGGADRRRRARLLRRRRPEEPLGQGRGLLGGGAARRLRRHRAARDAQRAGDRAGQRLRARRRLRDGAGLRPRGGLRGGQLRPARAAGRPHAARRRHDAAAAPDPVPPGDGHDADRPARQGARGAGAGPRQRGGAARRAGHRGRALGRSDPGLRAAVAAGHQAGGAPDRPRCRPRRPRPAPAGAGGGPAVAKTPTKACWPSSRSASRSGRAADRRTPWPTSSPRACIDVKDGACVKCCPVDCIYEGGAHAVHPSRRVHRLRHLRVGLPGRGHLRGPPAAGAELQPFHGDQPRVLRPRGQRPGLARRRRGRRAP